MSKTVTNKVVLSLLLVNLLAACSSTKAPEQAATPSQDNQQRAAASTQPAVATTNPDTAATATAETAAREAAAAKAVAEKAAAEEAARKAAMLNSPLTPLAKRSVHFPFDVDTIQPQDKLIIEENGAFLAGMPEQKVRVEGNADERGSSEYNLALGQRRANNTKKALELTGAKAGQIETISYGEERPMAPGHDEASWAQNRRADINYNYQ